MQQRTEGVENGVIRSALGPIEFNSWPEALLRIILPRSTVKH